MAYENIKLRKGNVTVVDGYFYMFDEELDSLIVKTDDGSQAFSYPLDTTISNSVVSLEYDGVNFWSLENTSTGLIIRRWLLENYICKLQDTFTLTSGTTTTYDSNAFAIEHYHTTFSSNEVEDQTELSINNADKLDSTYVQKIFLGPSTHTDPQYTGKTELCTVSHTGTGTVYITGDGATGGTKYAYNVGDPVHFYSTLWLFNNYNGTDSSEGALYRFSAYTGSRIGLPQGGGEYKDVRASTFFTTPAAVFGSAADSLVYVKGTNAIFLDLTDFSSSHGSMIMDNVEDDQATTIPIYDITIEGNNVYRLQLKATYYGTTESFDDNTYNYQLSTLEPFITSISLQADPAILPANGSSTSTITAIVKDQFNNPIVGKNVLFTDDDTVGVITSSDSTDSSGVANATYTAGTEAREVRVTATAEQG